MPKTQPNILHNKVTGVANTSVQYLNGSKNVLKLIM